MSIQALLLQAQDLSQELLQRIGPEIYDYRLFQGFNVPELNIELFEERLVGLLKTAGSIPEETRVYVEPYDFSNELLGIVMYLFKTNRIDIHTARHLNKCKERLVVCKELCQIYLDKKEGFQPKNGMNHFCKEIYKQIFELVELHNETAVHFDNLNLVPDDQNRNEFLSFFMAVTLIFPINQRADFKLLYKQAMDENNNFKLYDLAYAYRMPQFVLKFFIKRMLPYYNSLS